MSKTNEPPKPTQVKPAWLMRAERLYADRLGELDRAGVDQSLTEWTELSDAEQRFELARLSYLQLEALADLRRAIRVSHALAREGVAAARDQAEALDAMLNELLPPEADDAEPPEAEAEREPEPEPEPEDRRELVTGDLVVTESPDASDDAMFTNHPVRE